MLALDMPVFAVGQIPPGAGVFKRRVKLHNFQSYLNSKPRNSFANFDEYSGNLSLDKTQKEKKKEIKDKTQTPTTRTQYKESYDMERGEKQ
jgi:hypothetical protein